MDDKETVIWDKVPSTDNLPILLAEARLAFATQKQGLFRFGLGARVYRVQDFSAAKTHFELDQLAFSNGARDRLVIPPPLTVIEHKIQICHGGVQYFYLVSGGTLQIRAQEMTDLELVSYEEVEALYLEQAGWCHTIKAKARRNDNALVDSYSIMFRGLADKLNATTDALNETNGILMDLANTVAPPDKKPAPDEGVDE